MTPAQKNYARRLIGQSSLEKKRAQEKHERRLAREEASAPSRERAAQLSIALGWTSPTIPTTGDDPHERARVMERERRARREKRDEHERLLFSHGRAHERLVITRELAAAQEAGAGVTRVRSLEERTRRLQIRSGAREGRESPLTIDQLYLDGVLPPVHDTTRKHQECSLCGHVKCHPVSNCYACIRLHLETDWRCPHPACGRIMQGAPFRHESEEEERLWQQRISEARRHAAFVALLSQADVQQDGQAWAVHNEHWVPIPSEPYDWAAATNNFQGWGPGGWGNATPGTWGTRGWGPDDPPDSDPWNGPGWGDEPTLEDNPDGWGRAWAAVASASTSV
ncbi:hypothetical protein C8R43DRAFT_958005 [Mycena crocata]|nr:hypothetical protein C8R43DRAFT_958005 [Mycena crocata]